MDIQQVKISKKGITVKYQTDSYESLTYFSEDMPLPSFFETVNDLKKDVLYLCELDTASVSEENVFISSVSISLTGTVIIHASLKPLFSNGRINISSPPKDIFTPNMVSAEGKPIEYSTFKHLTPETADRILALENEAKLFARGHHAQQKLPFGEDLGIQDAKEADQEEKAPGDPNQTHLFKEEGAE
jgi:hypothetical protein